MFADSGDLTIPDFLRRVPGEQRSSGIGAKTKKIQRDAPPVPPAERYVRERLSAEEAETVIARDRATIQALQDADHAARAEAFRARIDRLKELRASGQAPPRFRVPAVRAPRASKVGAKTGDVMAKKAKTTEVAAPRETSRPVGKVSEFKQVREDSNRGKLIKFVKGSPTALADVEKELGVDRKNVMTILHLLNKTCGFGYDIKNEKVSISYPGERTWRDALKPAAAEKKAA